MKKIDNKLFYQVAAWMINDLNLKGQELICYAIIYSLSQLGQGRYFAGLDYLASFMQCSQPTASKALKGLQDRGLIDKEEVTTETGRRVLYYCTNPDEDEKESYRGVNKKFMDGVNKKFMDNNIKDIENKKRLSNDNPKDDYPDDFLEFYNAYGYAKSKYKAYLSWKKLSKKDKKAAIDAIPAYKNDCKINDREMKYPSTYLNQRTWEDDFDISSNKEEKEEDSAEEETLYPEGMDAEQWNEITMWMCNKVPLIAGKIDPISFGQMKDMAGDSKLFSELLKQVNEDFSLDSSHTVKSVFYKRLKEYRNGQKG